MTLAADPVAIRPAATVVLWRGGPAADSAEVLMGQRGAGAAFMPSKFVFPGGGVDAGDEVAGTAGAVLGHLPPICRHRLGLDLPEAAPTPTALLHAALRELAEETGLRLSAPREDPGLRFIFRAITPPGSSRRFDARFFLVPADLAQGDKDGFAEASGELSGLHWVSLAEARALDLPFITEIVLSEVAAILAGQDQPGVPFFDNSGPRPQFRRLG